MYRTILVPLDGSSLSERALPMASILAQATGAQIVLVRAAWATALPGVDAGEAQFRAVEEAETYLNGVASRLGERGLRAEIAVPYATAAEGILLEIELRHADVVVMCTHGRSGLGRWIYGSVAEAVLSKSPVPILLVRPTGPLEGLALEWGRPRLLVPLDGSPFAETALPYASALARALDATVMLCRAIVPPASPSPDLALAGPVVAEEVVQEEQIEAESYLSTLAVSLKEQGLRVQTVVRSEAAAESILEESQTSGVGLIVMATHGRTGLGRLLFGSVAMEVLQRGLLPLLLVRPHDLLKGEKAGQPAEAVLTH